MISEIKITPPPDNSKTIHGHPSHFGKRRWYRNLRDVIEAVNSMIVDLGMDQLTFGPPEAFADYSVIPQPSSVCRAPRSGGFCAGR